MSEDNGGYKGFRSMFSGSMISPSKPKSSDPDLNIPFTGGDISSIVGYDPRVLQQIQKEDQYILPYGQTEHYRGRFEMSFSNIGGGVLTGAAVGGLMGFNSGRKQIEGKGFGRLFEPKSRTRMLNHVSTLAAERGRQFGVIALLYSIFGAMLEYGAFTENQDVNSIAAGTLTGILFKSTGGLKSCAVGAGVGFGFAAVARLAYNKYKLSDF